MKEFDRPRDEVSTLRHLFSENRAEWAPENFKDLFVTPTYLNKLETARPSFLVGGRGTGKTTTLQSLGYNTTLKRLEADGCNYSDQHYLGVLVRMNKNRVHAFKGEHLSIDNWRKAFAHYFNLIVCLELSQLAIWLEHSQQISIPNEYIAEISFDLGLKEASSFEQLRKLIKNAISQLQLYVNTPFSTHEINFSVAESPLRKFSEILEENEALEGRVIFCCIDEYENLLDYQQGVINTYIKHASPPLSYKVGVRKYGVRNWNTTDTNDMLNTPDDYAAIEIDQEGFEYFATEVANQRLSFANKKGIPVPTKLSDFLENLSIADEAIKLGANQIAAEILSELNGIDENIFEYFAKKPASETYFLRFWQAKENTPIQDLANHWYKNEAIWNTRYGNHSYASLFWLSKGRKGLRYKKYYSGAKTILALAGGNIRYFLELIDNAIYHEVGDQNSLRPEPLTLKPLSQTKALRDVGLRRLDQLEGLSDSGVHLKRLVLAIGKVFFELARTPANRSPEVNSFIINGQSEDLDRIRDLLEEGVGHLAFEASPRTKETSSSEIRDNEYRLHPIYSGFFVISYRKKRRATFDAKDLLEVVEGKPSLAINTILSSENISSNEDLPEQLAFFSSFYDGDRDNK